jgi:hypothetical protein
VGRIWQQEIADVEVIPAFGQIRRIAPVIPGPNNRFSLENRKHLVYYIKS